MSASEPTPIELHLDRERELRIRWSDGRQSVIPLVELRKACPCATCRADRERRASNPLAVIEPAGDEAAMVKVAAAELVGRYGLKVRWQDGHDTGIYDFGLLRQLG